MNTTFYVPAFSGDEANQEFNFDSTQSRDSYSNYTSGLYADTYAPDTISVSHGTASHDIVPMIESQLMIPNMFFAAIDPAARRSVSPLSSHPTPGQLLQMLEENPALGITTNGSRACAPADGRSFSIAPSALHSPYVTPVHSRHGSFQSQPPYEHAYSSLPLYNGDMHPSYSASNQYGAHLTAPNQPLNEVFTPPMSIAPTLLYSPSTSRRPSFQPAPASREQSPAIMRVSLTPRSPMGSPCNAHARSPSTCSRHSDREDSGTSSYSPYTHGRNLSTSTVAFSPVSIPITPHIRAGSLSTTDHSALSPAWSAGSLNAMGGGFSKFPLNSRTDLTASAKKRKRRDAVQVESEDEYTGAIEDVEASDEDYEEEFGMKKGRVRSKKGKRIPKKQKLVPGATPTSMGGGFSPIYASNHANQSTRSGSVASSGTEIKVEKLIPITRDTLSCPHCGFIPGNRRYSDLKRHWEAHLVKEAAGKTRWACLDCGHVEEIVEGEIAENGTTVRRVITEFVSSASSRKIYTRKDSARRHWNADHGEKKGMVWHDALVVKVDRVRDE